MKLKDFIKKLQKIKPELQDKNVYAYTKNALKKKPKSLHKNP